MPSYTKPVSIIPQNDEQRLTKLYTYGILDTPSEEAFDKIAKLAAQIFDTPSAFVSFVDKDRVFFKSNISSLGENQVLRQDSLCSLAILENKLTVFSDTHQIPDLLASPHVSCEGGIRFYAGAPLKSPEGYQLGTLCVVDAVPREVTEKQLQMLETLSSIVVDELEQRRAAKKAIRIQTDLMNMAVHELKNPALNIAALATLILKKNSGNESSHELAEHLKICSEDISTRLDSMLKLSQMEEADFKLHLEPVDVCALLTLVKNDFKLLAYQKRQVIKLQCTQPITLKADRARVREVFENLLGNAIKYAYAATEITIRARLQDDGVIVEFTDQGQGLDEQDLEKLFTRFAKLSSIPTGKERSNGLGLSIVKTLVELHKGNVWAKSEGKNKGSSFFVWLPL